MTLDQFVAWLPLAALAIGAVLAVIFAWPHAIALRGEEIRSLCVVTLIAVLTFSLGRFDGEANRPWYDPMWLLAIVAMVTLALIAWGANYFKAKVAKAQLEAGRQPTGNVARPMSAPAPTVAASLEGAQRPDDPDAKPAPSVAGEGWNPVRPDNPDQPKQGD